MPDHVHLLISPAADDAEIGKILRAIKASPAKRAIQFLEDNSPYWLEKITRRRGNRQERPFWQSGGGYDRNVVGPRSLVAMIDYIHANPVRKQFVERPRDWHWSSAAWYDDQSDIPIPVDQISFDWLE